MASSAGGLAVPGADRIVRDGLAVVCDSSGRFSAGRQAKADNQH